jgi:hypothetical protein
MIIKNDKGREFFVRVVKKGERWGFNDCLTHDKADPLIEFYDRTYANTKSFGERGQFVSNYAASTLAEHPDGAGLILWGTDPAWQIDAEAARPVVELARELAARA